MPDLVYYDSSVWLALFLPNTAKPGGYRKKQQMQANILLESLKSGKYRCCVSGIVIMEVIHVIRTKTIQSESRAGVSSGERKIDLVEKVAKRTDWFKAVLKKMRDDGHIELIGYQGSLDEMHGRVKSCMDGLKIGKLIVEAGLDKPEPHGYRYLGPGHVDIEHAILAHDARCSILFTFDSGFCALENLPMFTSLKFINPAL